MKLNSSSTNTTSYTTTAAVHEKSTDTIKKNMKKNPKAIKIKFQTLLLMMMLNHFKQQEKITTVSLHQDPNHL